MNFRPGEKLPDIEDFGCDQLWEVCRSYLRIWDTTTGQSFGIVLKTCTKNICRCITN
jgi:hypothetical protein